MDLGIKGKKALVCGASKGLGWGCANSLAREGCEVTIVGRTQANINATAKAMQASSGSKVTAVAADITTPEGRVAALAACPQPDILVTNAGGPPPGDFRKFSREDWIKAIDGNMLTPIELIRATVDGMIARRFGRIINITSSAVKAPIDILALSNGARSGLTGFVAGVSRAIVQHNVTINNMLPERFDTPRQQQMAKLAMAMKNITYEEARAEIADSIAAKRFGRPEEFGDACAFLCSAQAGFISGQNLQLDGGSYHGLI